MQKCRFWSVKATLSQSKIIYFINSFLFYRFLFLYFTLSSCVKFITPFTGFQNNKYELSKNANTLFLNPETIYSAMLRNIVKYFFLIHYGLIVNYLLFIWHFNEI